jgi:D-alanyl-D-alanine carboxypeptidase
MSQSSGVDAAPSLVPPRGFDQLINTFGNLFAYIRSDDTLDPRWQVEFITRTALPFPLPLSWERSRFVDGFLCHKLLAAPFTRIFEDIQRAGLASSLTSFGGCFNFRPQRTGTRLSTHAWGIAIDLSPENNAQGTAGTMDPRVVSIFSNAGFSWGGHWKDRSRDPMHFQFCTGY